MKVHFQPKNNKGKEKEDEGRGAAKDAEQATQRAQKQKLRSGEWRKGSVGESPNKLISSSSSSSLVGPKRASQPLSLGLRKPQNGASTEESEASTGNADGGGGTDHEMRQRQRMDAALEIMAKEISYISALTTLVNCYLKPLRQARASEQAISAIFGNVELILEANKKFLEKLKQSSKSWNLDGIRLGPVIDEFLPWLTLYADYCANYPHSQAFIRKKGLQSEKLAPFFQNELAVKALLIKPVQKIPQYMVMFERLLRWTDKDHEDYAILQDALLQIRRVAEVVDETVGLRQALAKLRDVMSKLTGNVPAGIMCGDNVFVKDGMMTKQCRKAAKQRYVLLLSGMLLYGIKELHKYRIRHYILLSDDVQIEKFVPIPDIPAKGLCNAFEVTGKTKSFILWCSTAQQKDEWIEALATAHSIRQQYQHCLRKRKASMLALKGFNTSQEVISPSSSPTPAVSPSSSASLSTSPRAICHPSSSSSVDITVLELSTSPVWDPDNFRDTCPICELRFTVRRRRHHCRACGGLVCDRCSPQRCYVTALGKSARVCVNCCPPTSSSPI